MVSGPIFREVDIESFENEKDGLLAWGYVTLKVRRDSEILGIKVKIESVPQELIDNLRKKQPRPPSKTVMLDPAMPEAQALGVTTRQKATIPDYNDPIFLEQQEEYNLQFRQEIVGRGLKSKLKLADGRQAETPEERYKALQERGITGIHFAEIAQEILNLTTWTEEERVNFLKPGSGPTALK